MYQALISFIRKEEIEKACVHNFYRGCWGLAGLTRDEIREGGRPRESIP